MPKLVGNDFDNQRVSARQTYTDGFPMIQVHDKIGNLLHQVNLCLKRLYKGVHILHINHRAENFIKLRCDQPCAVKIVTPIYICRHDDCTRYGSST